MQGIHPAHECEAALLVGYGSFPNIGVPFFGVPFKGMYSGYKRGTPILGNTHIAGRGLKMDPGAGEKARSTMKEAV